MVLAHLKVAIFGVFGCHQITVKARAWEIGLTLLINPSQSYTFLGGKTKMLPDCKFAFLEDRNLLKLRSLDYHRPFS